MQVGKASVWDRGTLMTALRRSYLLRSPLEDPGLVEYLTVNGYCMVRPINEVIYLQNTYLRAHMVVAKFPPEAKCWTREAKRDWIGSKEAVWTLGRGPWKGDIDVEGELVVTYLAPTVDIRDWLVNEQRTEPLEIDGRSLEVTLSAWKSPAEMAILRRKDGQRRSWVKVFKASHIAEKWVRGALEHFCGHVLEEQVHMDEERAYTRYVIDGPLASPYIDTLAIATRVYTCQEVRVVTSETPFCELCRIHGHINTRGRCLNKQESIKEMQDRAARLAM